MGKDSITLPLELLQKYHSEYFVETGSFYGGGIESAIEAGFSDIRSIEIDVQLFLYCQEKFQHDLRVTLYFGDSLKELPKAIADIDDRITFWLDAHAGNSPTVGEVAAPLLCELDIIAKHPRKDHILMIDDVRLFDKAHWAGVTKFAVIDRILKINPAYEIIMEDSKGYPKDIMIAFVDNTDYD